MNLAHQVAAAWKTEAEKRRFLLQWARAGDAMAQKALFAFYGVRLVCPDAEPPAERRKTRASDGRSSVGR